MEKYNKVLGNCGEDAAVKFLKKNGYSILERNFNIRGGEIDIIARKGDYVVFVEVKTRSNDDYGGGISAITYAKQQHLIKTAQTYLLGKDDCSARFDVIVVNGCMVGKKFKAESIEHIENAF